MSSVPKPPRTYNQNHAPRKYTPGKRRVSIYWTWSYPWEANQDTTELDNRFSTMTEVRRIAWQTSDKHGPNITPQQAAAHYTVNGLGFAANAVLPEQKVSVGVKYFHEFECRSTYQGYTLQISAAITF
jgi:hypothetical protein